MACLAADQDLGRQFDQTVQPFLQAYCITCHGGEKPKAQFDLSPYTSIARVARDHEHWKLVLEKLETAEMPPEEAKKQLPLEVRRAVIDWIQELRRREAQRNAGDPGVVLARRLSNAEYNYTIRDLTGVDIRPAHEFPVDPANEAGFDNSGESLAMSPAFMNKYLEAATRVAEHLVLKPEGFVFAPHPAVTETDRDKYCVKRIVDFYERQPVNYADYFQAAWKFTHREHLARPDATLASLAAELKVSSQYLNTVWSALTDKEAAGPLAALQAMWRALPSPHDADAGEVRLACEQMRDFVTELRGQLRPEFKNLTLRGISNGSQPLVLWKNRQYATNRMRYLGGAPEFRTEPPAPAQTSPADEDAARAPERADPLASSDRDRLEAAYERFCRIFPDAFYVSERGRIFLENSEGDRGRLLSAGFHLMVGYFRDDQPLYELILDEAGQRELDALWHELNFITSAPMRQYKDFIFFERAEPPRFMQGAEFDFARSEDKDATSEEKIRQLAELYLAKARETGGQGPALEAIAHYFETISAEIRRVEQARAAAEPSHLAALLAFAERAYRRPLTSKEREDQLAFYRSLRQEHALEHEEALRLCIAGVLVSPHFCYRMDFAATGGREALPNAGPATNHNQPRQSERKMEPLSDYALASRLSYFLWSSLPDEALLAQAAAGSLQKPETIMAEARRLLQDRRVRGLAVEFAGQWLDFRRFEEHNAVDRERFPNFNDRLRQAMFEEPIQFFMDVLREDRPVLDFLYGDHTFVNKVLAEHYEIPDYEAGAEEWRRIENARSLGRGGLLPMAVFLTQNAPGLRTSPVKRGYWVVRRVLGERIPPPPPTVPELPSDEAKLGEMMLREALARHREDKSCSGCHERFDSLGLVFEGYGPIGERRVRDLGGRPVDTRASFPGGGEGAGLDGLLEYLREYRQDEFLDNLCRKLLAYGLSRSLTLSDEPLIQEMRARLAANRYRFSSLVEAIVTSTQFRKARAHSVAGETADGL